MLSVGALSIASAVLAACTGTQVGAASNGGSQTPPSSVPSARRTPTSSAVPSTFSVPKPPITWMPIPFGQQRKDEMAAYAERHYGIHTWRLIHPKVIVEHYTAGPSFSSAWNTFAADSPDPGLGELPGVCSHFIVDTDGTIYQLVPLDVMCRHTTGLNDTAIGIEMVGTSDRQILANADQLGSALDLTAWVAARYGIELRNVIGHNESLTSPYRRELYPPWRCQTHADWNHADMQVFRAKLARILHRHDVPLGPPATPVVNTCT